MQRFQTIPRWAIVLAIFIFCCCCMTFLKKCLKIENFSDQSSAKVTVTNYWANWCGHSTRFVQTDSEKGPLEWDSFKKALNESTKLAFAQDFDCGVDATIGTEEEKAAKAAVLTKCAESGVLGYPSVVITYTDKDKENKKIDYDGPRTKEALNIRVDEILGTLK